MYCPRCGFNNAEGMNFCSHCGSPLAPPQPVMQQYGPPPTADKSKLLIIIAIIVAAIVIVAVIAAILLTSGSSNTGLVITDQTHTETAYLSVVVFSVTVSNPGAHTDSATLKCTVTYGNGDSYSGSQDITLDAGQSSTYQVMVTTSFTHMLDTSGAYAVHLS